MMKTTGKRKYGEIMPTTALMCCVIENGKIKYVSQFRNQFAVLGPLDANQVKYGKNTVPAQNPMVFLTC